MNINHESHLTKEASCPASLRRYEAWVLLSQSRTHVRQADTRIGHQHFLAPRHVSALLKHVFYYILHFFKFRALVKHFLGTSPTSLTYLLCSHDIFDMFIYFHLYMREYILLKDYTILWNYYNIFQYNWATL